MIMGLMPGDWVEVNDLEALYTYEAQVTLSPWWNKGMRCVGLSGQEHPVPLSYIVRVLTEAEKTISRTTMRPTQDPSHAPALLKLAALHWANKESLEQERLLKEALDGKLPVGEYLVADYMIVISKKPGDGTSGTSVHTIRRLQRLG